MKHYGFQKSVRLLRSADFRTVYANGRRRNFDWVVAFTLATGKPSSRIGFTVPAAFGPAVDRNRIKRRLREAARKNWALLGPGWDIVLNPRRSALTLSSARIDMTVQELFRSCTRGSGKQARPQESDK